MALVSNTSLADTEPALQCFVTGLLYAGMFDVSQRLLIQFVIPEWYCSHGNRSRTALRACSSSGLEKVSNLRLVFSLSSDDPGPWDQRDPLAVEPSPCPSMFQDLGEPNPLDTDVAIVSNVVTRAAKLLTICSMFVIFASYDATVWESVWTQFSNLDTLRMSSDNFATCTNISLIFSFIVRAQYPVPSRSRRRGGWYRRYWHICSIARTCHEKGWESTIQGCRHLDKTKPDKLVNGTNTAHVRTRNGLSQSGYGFLQRDDVPFHCNLLLDGSFPSTSGSWIPVAYAESFLYSRAVGQAVVEMIFLRRDVMSSSGC